MNNADISVPLDFFQINICDGQSISILQDRNVAALFLEAMDHFDELDPVKRLQ